jgi:hypothetical protein
MVALVIKCDIITHIVRPNGSRIIECENFYPCSFWLKVDSL